MIMKTEPAQLGASVSNATKVAILETGAKIEVPLFVEGGDIVKVDTHSNEYIQRV
jgi:elongation factor P